MQILDIIRKAIAVTGDDLREFNDLLEDIKSDTPDVHRETMRLFCTFLHQQQCLDSEFKPLGAAKMRPDTEVFVVTTEEEEVVLRAHYGNQVHLVAVEDELLFVLYPNGLHQSPAEHVGTLRGEQLAWILTWMHLAVARNDTGLIPPTQHASGASDNEKEGAQ